MYLGFATTRYLLPPDLGPEARSLPLVNVLPYLYIRIIESYR